MFGGRSRGWGEGGRIKHAEKTEVIVHQKSRFSPCLNRIIDKECDAFLSLELVPSCATFWSPALLLLQRRFETNAHASLKQMHDTDYNFGTEHLQSVLRVQKTHDRQHSSTTIQSCGLYPRTKQRPPRTIKEGIMHNIADCNNPYSNKSNTHTSQFYFGIGLAWGSRLNKQIQTGAWIVN